MGNNEIRNPIQKRSIEKKEKIIEAGFTLICEKGYHNTNTAEIAKKAGVSTGIIYSYFQDKHDIFLEGIRKHGISIFHPTFAIISDNIEFDKKNLDNILRKMIHEFIENHKLSKIAHQEIMSMTHSDTTVSEILNQEELTMTTRVTDFFAKNGFSSENLQEKVHISIGLIDNLCHEIVYHQHETLDYEKMIDIVVNSIVFLLN